MNVEIQEFKKWLRAKRDRYLQKGLHREAHAIEEAYNKACKFDVMFFIDLRPGEIFEFQGDEKLYHIKVDEEKVFDLEKKMVAHLLPESYNNPVKKVKVRDIIIKPEQEERCEKIKVKKDIHTEHCCVEHGCKYGEDDFCSVVNKLKPQSFPCELCRW